MNLDSLSVMNDDVRTKTPFLKEEGVFSIVNSQVED